jgi:hypothetical protein
VPHLKDISAELQQDDVLQIFDDSHPEARFLINFGKWRSLYSKACDAFDHNIDFGRRSDSDPLLGLVENKLQSIRVDPESEEYLKQRNLRLRGEEERLAAQSKPETDMTGWSSPSD